MSLVQFNFKEIQDFSTHMDIKQVIHSGTETLIVKFSDLGH